MNKQEAKAYKEKYGITMPTKDLMALMELRDVRTTASQQIGKKWYETTQADIEAEAQLVAESVGPDALALLEQEATQRLVDLGKQWVRRDDPLGQAEHLYSTLVNIASLKAASQRRNR